MSRNSFVILIALAAVISVGWVGCGKKNGASGDSGAASNETRDTAPAAASAAPSTADALDNVRPVDSAATAASPTAAPTAPNSGKTFGAATAPALQSLVTLWQQGDRAKAVSQFVETDWKVWPLFAADSVLSFSEAQFGGLPASDLEAKSREMFAQTGTLKQLAAAVAQAGTDAAARNDGTQASKYFNALKECGRALDNPASLKLLRLVGQAIEKRADTELSKLPP